MDYNKKIINSPIIKTLTPNEVPTPFKLCSRSINQYYRQEEQLNDFSEERINGNILILDYIKNQTNSS